MTDTTILADANDERADRAQPGLADYAEASYDNPKDEDAATHIGDMISALLHLAQREGCNPFAVIQSGITHYCAERADPEDIGPDIEVTICVNGYDGSDILPHLDAVADALAAMEDGDGDEDELQAAFDAAVAKVENRQPPIEYLTPTPSVFILTLDSEPWVGDWVPRQEGAPVYETREAADERNAFHNGRFIVMEVVEEDRADGVRGFRIKTKD